MSYHGTAALTNCKNKKKKKLNPGAMGAVDHCYPALKVLSEMKFAFFFVAEFVSSFSRLLDVELPIFGVVTVLFTMYAV